MKLYFAVFLLTLANLADSTRDLTDDYDPDEEVDSLVNRWNYYALRLVSSLHLPAYKYGTIKLEGQVLYGLNSLQQLGEAEGYYNASEKHEQLDFHVGFGMLALAFDRMTLDDQQLGPGIVRIADTSLRVKFATRLLSQESCDFDFNFTLERFTNITLYSTEPEFNGRDLSEYEQRIMGKLNDMNYIVSKAIKGAYKSFLCEES